MAVMARPQKLWWSSTPLCPTRSAKHTMCQQMLKTRACLDWPEILVKSYCSCYGSCCGLSLLLQAHAMLDTFAYCRCFLLLEACVCYSRCIQMAGTYPPIQPATPLPLSLAHPPTHPLHPPAHSPTHLSRTRSLAHCCLLQDGQSMMTQLSIIGMHAAASYCMLCTKMHQFWSSDYCYNLGTFVVSFSLVSCFFNCAPHWTSSYTNSVCKYCLQQAFDSVKFCDLRIYRHDSRTRTVTALVPVTSTLMSMSNTVCEADSAACAVARQNASVCNLNVVDRGCRSHVYVVGEKEVSTQISKSGIALA